MRALLLASPNHITARIIDVWLQCGHSIAEVWCRPEDEPAFHKISRQDRAYPELSVACLLKRAGVPVITRPPFRKWPDFEVATRATKADVLISSLFMRKIPVELLDLFPDRAVNFHPAMLPHYRGPAPTRGMLLDGLADHYGGVTLHLLSEGLDEGPIIAQRSVPRSASPDDFSWRYRLAEAAGDLAAHVLPAFLAGDLKAVPQDLKSGSYRRLSDREATFGPHLSVAELEQRFSTFGPHHVEAWARADGSKIKLAGIQKRLGEKTGEPDRQGRLFMDADVADGRVRLIRSMPWHRFSRARARAKARSLALQRIRASR
jgi:methionyl-tRNA formyltransferase